MQILILWRWTRSVQPRYLFLLASQFHSKTILMHVMTNLAMKAVGIFSTLLLMCLSAYAQASPGSGLQASQPIVIVFHHPPAFQPLPFQKPGNGPYTPPKCVFTLSYIGEHGMVEYVDLGEAREYPDTLVLHPRGEWMSVAHDFYSIETWPFYFKRGDTVHFTYQGERPIAKVVNRPTAPYDLNYEWRKRQALGIDSISPTVRRDNFSFVMAYHREHPKNTIPESVKAFEAVVNREIRTQLQRERRFLDSIHARGDMSSAVYAFFSQSLQYDSLGQALFEQKGEGYQGTYFARNDAASLTMASYHRAWRIYLVRGLRKHMPTFKQKNGFRVDARALFDSVAHSPLFAGKTKILALHDCLEEIIQAFSIADQQAYLQKFKAYDPDPALLQRLQAKYRLDQPITSALYVEDLTGRPDSLRAMLAATSGQVLYIDFWASWCAPCLRAMPAAAELRERLADENVTFAYISMDENPEAWANASRRLGFDSLAHHYRIRNRRTSRFLEEMDISTIPRYLIYDPAGKLVYPRAPGPDDARIEGILRDLARE